MALPQVVIQPHAAKRVRHHDGWIFRDEIVRAPEGLPAGELVEAVTDRGGFAATCAFNPASHIPLRVFTTTSGDTIDRAWLARRLARAVAKRARITGTDAKRLVFSEADGLPGLIADQYGTALVIQIRTAGMERLRDLMVDLLHEQLQPSGILERSDKEFRQEEGLAPTAGVLRGAVPERILIREEPWQFWVDPHHGLKTGFYLDQRLTRQKLRQAVEPNHRVLDTFSYTGSMGIAAATRGARVVCVEQQEPFVELAKENAKLNGVADRMEFVAGNAFYWLDAQAKGPSRYDWVVLDPPALAKSKAATQQGRRALHHLLVQGLRALAPEGRMLLSVCTYHLLRDLEEIVRIAAGDDDVRLTVCDQWTQASDHPWILQLPATRYLASWLLERDAPSAA
ncbi:MAG: class I SAM-dependent rRNA methyltransferase [Candidatus Omnitrophica bacterium]|nr:class I SAM-dependent rRNA methyltransferase [Candidatus Omnitrophota bacterium]